MGNRSAYAPWFLWAYIGTFVLLTALAIWWVTDVVRRPAERYPGSWPLPKLRWGLVPGAWLLVIGAQLVAWIAGVAFKAGAAAQKLVSAVDLGLITLVLLLAMVVVGIAYLLRVAFPSIGQAAEEPGEGIEHESEEGEAQD